MAAALAPKSASALVTLHEATDSTEIGSCPHSSGAHVINDRLLSDGSTAPLTVTDKQVLVVTSADVRLTGATPSSKGTVSVRRGPNGDVILFIPFESDAAGQATGSIVIPDGFAVEPSSLPLCADDAAVTMRVFLRGYLAADK
ncbi:MAG TPA: hypothetical protein VEL28_05600 [Candidatus Binatia bacterium]|nr:hypothetical protein [Candidatus Binatia bacterium]